jgi:hypothetical protein
MGASHQCPASPIMLHCMYAVSSDPFLMVLLCATLCVCLVPTVSSDSFLIPFLILCVLCVSCEVWWGRVVSTR